MFIEITFFFQKKIKFALRSKTFNIFKSDLKFDLKSFSRSKFSQ